MGKIRFLSQGKISDILIRCARTKYLVIRKVYADEGGIKWLYYSNILSLVCNVPVSCKTNADRNQLGAWLDSGLIVE